MNTITPEKKQTVLKTLAVAGILALCAVIAWLAIQIVKVFPSALSALTIIAEEVYTFDPENNTAIAITPLPAPVAAGEVTTLSWHKAFNDGSYNLSYECTEGVALLLHKENSVEILPCDQPYILGAVDNAHIVATSSKGENATISYTITYVAENETVVSQTGESTITITPPSLAGGENPTPDTATSTPTKPTPQVAGIATTTVEYSFEYTPVSNENAAIDLRVTNNGVGEIRNNVFIATQTLETGEEGAFQFVVHNIGGKTSANWTYQADLPDGTDYESGPQKPLLPNERVTITLGITPLEDDGRASYGIIVETNEDQSETNNRFTASVLVN